MQYDVHDHFKATACIPPKYSEINEPLILELLKRGGKSAPSAKDQSGKTIYNVLADEFDLSNKANG